MKKLSERLTRCTPYLRVATLVSRETIYDLMMQTDLETVYTMRAVMLVGMGTYEHNEVHPAIYPCKLFGETLDMMPVFLTPSMEKELTTYGIIVAGFDLRGHGENPAIYDTATLGKSGWEESLMDMHHFRMMLRKRYPGLPLYMMGFSLGSFLLREYLGRYQAPAGAILIGTGTQPAHLLSILMKIVEGEIKNAGFNRNTPLVQRLSFETYNSKFTHNTTNADWLCADQNQLNRYLNDRECRKVISAGLFYQLLASMEHTVIPIPTETGISPCRFC